MAKAYIYNGKLLVDDIKPSTFNVCKTYNEEKSDRSMWQYFYDRSIQLWTVYPIDLDGCQLEVADHYHDKGQMNQVHSFKKVR